jgi:hypothetical protein
MNEPPLYGSDPEASIAVPEQSIRIDIAVTQELVPVDWASNRIRSDLIVGELQESRAVHGNQQPSVVGLAKAN